MQRQKFLAAFIFAGLAFALGVADATSLKQSKPIDVINWKHAELRGGLSAKRLIGTEVRGKDGKTLGEIEDVIVSARDRADAIIVESGGYLDIGDVHFKVPWSVVTLGPKLEYVSVPLLENHVPNFSLFADEPRVGPRAWRVTELIGDYVRLRAGTRYALVDDLLFDRHGNVKAIVVTPDVGWGRYGRFAYPYHGFDYGFDPGAVDYTLPYEKNEIMNLLPFNYEAIGIHAPISRKDRAASG